MAHVQPFSESEWCRMYLMWLPLLLHLVLSWFLYLLCSLRLRSPPLHSLSLYSIPLHYFPFNMSLP